MTDLVLPAAAPIETYIDETVSVLAELHEDTPKDVLAGFDFSAQGVWAFARPGAPPLKFSESLDDAGVVDGSLLTLVSVSRTERYRPLVEDVIDAIAVLDESPEFDRTALNRFVGLAIPFAALAVTVMSLVAWSQSGHDWWWAVALARARPGTAGRQRVGDEPLPEHRHGGELAGSPPCRCSPVLPRWWFRCLAASIPLAHRRSPVQRPCAVVDGGDAWRSAQKSGAGFVSGGHIDCDHGGSGRLRLRMAVLGAGRS